MCSSFVNAITSILFGGILAITQNQFDYVAGSLSDTNLVEADDIFR